MITAIALALLAALAAAYLTGFASRALDDNSFFSPALPAGLNALAIAVPLAGFVWITEVALRNDSPPSVSLVGQYFPIEDTVSVGNTGAVDYRVDIPRSVGVFNLRVGHTAENRSYNVQLDSGTVAVFVDGSPVNALELGLRGQVVFPGVGEVSWSSPWQCSIFRRCASRHITLRDTAGTNIETELPEEIRIDEDGLGLLTAPGDPFGELGLFVFSFDNKRWLSGDLSGVQSENFPKQADAPIGDIEFVATGFRTSLTLEQDAVQNRTLIRRSDTDVDTWIPPRESRDTVQIFVYSGLADSVASASRLPAVDLQIEAPSPAIERYSGFLILTDGTWGWHWSGKEQRGDLGDGLLAVPGDNEVSAAGHLLELPIPRDEPTRARNLMVAVWLIGLALIMATASRNFSNVVAPRVLILGGAYTLVMIRGAIALRAWVLPPSREEGAITTLILLIALPLFVVILEHWPLGESGGTRLPITARLKKLAPIDLGLVIAPCLSLLFILFWMPDWFIGVGGGAAVIVGAGIMGMSFLDHMLRGSADRAMERESNLLGFLGSSPKKHLPTWDMATAMGKALLAIFAFGVFFVAVGKVIDASWSIGVVALWIFVLGILALLRDRRRLFVPRITFRPQVYAGIGVTSGFFVPLLFQIDWWVCAGIAGVGGWIGARIAQIVEGPIHISSFRIRDIFDKKTVLILLGCAVALSIPSVASRVRVLAGYGLALGAMLATTRVLALFWHEHASRHINRARLDAPPISSPVRQLPILRIVLVTLAALSSFVIFLFADPGLTLLFLTATVGMVTVGFFMLGLARGAVGLGLLLVVVFGFWSYMNVPDSTLDQPLAELNRPQIRYAAALKPVALERHLAISNSNVAYQISRALHHEWGIREYAAGGTWGDGYLQTSFGGRGGISWPIALSDNVFSVFVLSEHGWVGGTAVLLVYLFLALSLLWGAQIAARNRETAPIALVLVGLALFIIVPAIYMAAANAGLFPLTGQNMPLLGMNSRADAGFGAWVIGLGILGLSGLGRLPLGTSYTTNEPVLGALARLSRAIKGLALCLIIGTLWLARSLWTPTHAEIENLRFEKLAEAVSEMVSRRDIRLAPTGDSIEILEAALVKPEFSRQGLIPRLVTRANEIRRIGRGQAARNCLYADPLFVISREDNLPTVSVRPNLCPASAPNRRGPAWSGSLVAGIDEPTATITVDGNIYSISAGEPGIKVHGRDQCPGTGIASTGSELHIDCDGDGESVSLRWSGGKLVIDSPRDSVIEGGRVLEPPLVSHEVRPRTIYEITQAATFIADITSGNQLTFDRWRNGEEGRVSIEGIPPMIKKLDSLVARGMRATNRSEESVSLSVSLDLQRSLTSRLADRCSRFQANGLLVCAVTIANPATGDLLALSSWERSAVVRRFRPVDPNLRNHPTASAIKPIMAAAALDAYPVLQTLEVEHLAEQTNTVAGWRLGSTPFRVPKHMGYQGTRVGWPDFLPPSNNLYEATLGFLALAAPDDSLPLLEPGGEGWGFWIGGREYRGMRPKWPESVTDTANTYALQNSPLAASLGKLFDVSVMSPQPPYYDRSLFADAVTRGIIPELTGWLQLISPDEVGLSFDTFNRDPQPQRNLASFFIGGSENRWNNVALTEAVARILTGKKVELRLIRGMGEEIFEADFADLNAPNREPILEGMRDVLIGDYGTARALRTLIPDGLAAYVKTGTLEEEDEFVGSLFIFALEPEASSSCPAVGAVYLSYRDDLQNTPPLHATDVFRDVVFPTLRGQFGWPRGSCPR